MEKNKRKAIIIKILIACAIIIGINIILTSHCNAKSYEVSNMNIKATIEDTGDVYVEQEITYDFTGDYNGVYVNIPISPEKQTLYNQNDPDQIYNATSVKIDKITLKNSTSEAIIDNVNNAFVGDNYVYIKEYYGESYTDRNYFMNSTNTTSSVNAANYEGIRIKIFLQSSYQQRTFKLYYRLKNLCVKKFHL